MKDIYHFSNTAHQDLPCPVISNVYRIADTYVNKEGRIGYADVIGFMNFVLFRSRVIIFVFIIFQ